MTTQQTEQHAEATTARVLALLALYEATRLDLPGFTRATGAAIYTGKLFATRAADVAVAALAGRAPLGFMPDIDRHLPRLEVAAGLIAETPELAPERLERLAVSEVLASEQHTTRRAIADHGFNGWREHVEPDACEVCQPFADALHDADEPWEPHHPRCRCEPRPVGEPAPLAVPVTVPTPAPARPLVTISRTAI